MPDKKKPAAAGFLSISQKLLLDFFFFGSRLGFSLGFLGGFFFFFGFFGSSGFIVLGFLGCSSLFFLGLLGSSSFFSLGIYLGFSLCRCSSSAAATDFGAQFPLVQMVTVGWRMIRRPCMQDRIQPGC